MTTHANRYFRLIDDMRFPGRWVLAQPEVDDGGRKLSRFLFNKSQIATLEGMPTIGISHPGEALDFSETDLGTPVISPRTASALRQLGVESEVQLIRSRVEGQSESYFILNTLRTIRCIDDARCEEVAYWLPEDNRPELTGQYQNVAGMKIDPAKVGGANMFRPWGWPVALIVSERVKNAMEAAGITGTEFIEV